MERLQSYILHSESVADASPELKQACRINLTMVKGSSPVPKSNIRHGGQSTTPPSGLSPQSSKPVDSDPGNFASSSATQPHQDTESANSTSPPQHPNDQPQVFLETKYGLRLTFNPTDLRNLYITLTPRTTPNDTPSDTPHAPSTSNRRYHLNLHPDFQTSHLFHSATHLPHPSSNPNIPISLLERQYPTLHPYYESWADTYDAEFVRSESHLGAKGPVFRDRGEGDAWEIEGFLMACWLVLWRDGEVEVEVETVRYMPGGKAYVIQAGSMARVFVEFLNVKQI